MNLSISFQFNFFAFEMVIAEINISSFFSPRRLAPYRDAKNKGRSYSRYVHQHFPLYAYAEMIAFVTNTSAHISDKNKTVERE